MPATMSQLQPSAGLSSFAAEDPGDWTPLLKQAQAADRAGVDRIVVSDHVVFGERLDEYGRPEIGGSHGGKQPTGPDGHWLEPLTLLSVIAGQTQRVRLGTNILIAAVRRPVVLSKTLATCNRRHESRAARSCGTRPSWSGIRTGGCTRTSNARWTFACRPARTAHTTSRVPPSLFSWRTSSMPGLVSTRTDALQALRPQRQGTRRAACAVLERSAAPRCPLFPAT